MLSKQQAKVFFLGGTFFVCAIFIGLTWHSLGQVPAITNEENLTEGVIKGKELWDENNCMGCHTILGEGAYYAPELTKVIDRRGPELVKTILMMEQPWAPKGRKMVAYGFSDEEANNLVEFFTWIGQMDLNGFPPEPNPTLEQ